MCFGMLSRKKEKGKRIKAIKSFNKKRRNEMRRNSLVILLLIIIEIGKISAQTKKWTLEDCINYAVTNNIGLQRQRLQTETSELNLFKSKMDILPTLPMA